MANRHYKQEWSAYTPNTNENGAQALHSLCILIDPVGLSNVKRPKAISVVWQLPCSTVAAHHLISTRLPIRLRARASGQDQLPCFEIEKRHDPMIALEAAQSFTKRELCVPLARWISDFLSRRGLQKPDGRPLFAYKTSSEEFRALRQLLQNLPGGQQVSPSYPQAWLLFAAEWWKREYSGGAWRWGPLCEAAGQRGLSHEKTRKLVIEGRRQWCLQTAIKNEGKRFIGLVAVNGGLLMRLVESAQGGLSGLLRMVTLQAVDYDLHDEQLRQAIEAQAALLPACYQQAPVYELLDNLIKAVLHIRRTYALKGTQDPIAKLQEECPQWEELFPIALDSQAAASLIKGLVRVTVSITPQSRRPLSRFSVACASAPTAPCPSTSCPLPCRHKPSEIKLPSHWGWLLIDCRRTSNCCCASASESTWSAKHCSGMTSISLSPDRCPPFKLCTKLRS